MVIVFVLLEGEYGESNIFCVVLVILNIDGIKEVLEIHMTN